VNKNHIDPNFAAAEYPTKGLRFFDALNHAAIALEGFPYFWENTTLCRLPERVLPALPELCRWVCRHPAGGLLRFRTDSRRIALRVQYETSETCPTTPCKALFGWDAYVGSGTHRTFVKTLYGVDRKLLLLDGIDQADAGKVREWTLCFPVRNHPACVELGLEAHATLAPPPPRTVHKPILFYGSSIVEGGCASRGGLTYPMIIGRGLDAHVINYGFGGSARGEPQVAEAIAALDLAALVIDYDHNAPSAEHLRKTYWKFFKRIRAKQPTLPILLVSSVDYHNEPHYYQKRAAVIEQTYRRARAGGDRHVLFLHGKTIFPRTHWWDCSGDHIHPNDLGFRYMADVIGTKLKVAAKL
jgi:hypothetical protein